MARLSKFDRLPPEVRERIGQLRDRGYTLDQLMDHLATLPLDPEAIPSRSGLGRHIKDFDAFAEELRLSREFSKGLVEQLGMEPESRQARLNIEVMQAKIMRLLAKGDLVASEVLEFSRALQALAQAQKVDAERTLKIRAEAERRTKAAAVDAAEKVGHEKGLSAETVEAIKAKILGVKLAPG